MRRSKLFQDRPSEKKTNFYYWCLINNKCDDVAPIQYTYYCVSKEHYMLNNICAVICKTKTFTYICGLKI